MCSSDLATDGRQVVVGCPRDIEPNGTGDDVISGSVYIFDRSVLRYQVSDVTQTEFALPVDYREPVAVVLNGVFLTNTAEYINGQFTVDNSNPAEPKVVLSSSVELTIGDTIEIENNIFRQVQRIVPEVIFEIGRAHV